MIDGWGISKVVALICILLHLADDKSTLVHVMRGIIRQQAIIWTKVQPGVC